MKLKRLLIPLGNIWAKLRKSLPYLVEEAEKAAKDGKITFDERKQLVMAWVLIIAEHSFGVKLGWLPRLIISLAVDIIAQKLPSKDIILPPIRKVF